MADLGACLYDGLNRRTKVFVNADTDDDEFDSFRHFYYNAGWQILEIRTTTSENDAPDSEDPDLQYVWSARYIDAPILRDENKDADGDCIDGDDERLYYANDANMNVTALTEADGDVVERYLYDPYGKVTILNGANGVDKDGAVTEWTEDTDQTASDVDNSILYCGYYHDWETGLYHVRNRYYHPQLGWITRDPAGYVDGMSLYEYCRSRPAIATDPMGLQWPPGYLPPGITQEQQWTPGEVLKAGLSLGEITLSAVALAVDVAIITIDDLSPGIPDEIVVIDPRVGRPITINLQPIVIAAGVLRDTAEQGAEWERSHIKEHWDFLKWLHRKGKPPDGGGGGGDIQRGGKTAQERRARQREQELRGRIKREEEQKNRGVEQRKQREGPPQDDGSSNLPWKQGGAAPPGGNLPPVEVETPTGPESPASTAKEKPENNPYYE